MRWFASAFALGLMMALFHRLTAGGALEARATLALGFLLVAAQLGGDIARRARLPRMTGYLLTGFVGGPAWRGLGRADEVGALRLIADAAVALIAFAAGSELTLDTLRRERVGLTRLAGGTILFPFAAVAAVMFSVGLWFPVTVHQPVGDRVAVALVLGTVAAASSPVVTMAVIGELDARGPFARAVLAVSVAQDVAVIVLLSLVLAVARLVTSAGAVNLLVAGTALAHLVGSVAVGAALGYALAAYVRSFKRDTALLLVAAAFIAAEAAQLVHLETVLVAVTAGFCVRNFFPLEDERLRGTLRRGSLPLYLVFFALAGAGLHLEVLANLWPWVLLVAGLRVVALRYGVLWAGREPAVSPVLARDGPLAPCTAAAPLVNLTAGEYRSADPRPSGDFVLRAVRGAGCVAFAANQSGSDIEYLLVPQSATGTPGSKSSFWLRGATIAVSSAPAPAPVAPSVQLAPAARFHEFLRESEQQLYLNNPPTIHPFTAPRFALAPPAVGDVGTFSVCSNLDCTSKTTVTATAKQVGVHIAIFEDNNKPSGGLSDADFLSLRYKFDTLLYVRDTLAFGRESDIDQNGVVIVLMTNAVNQLVSATECSTTGFVAGYFYGADLILGQGTTRDIYY